jgi:hypothetical protein
MVSFNDLVTRFDGPLGDMELEVRTRVDRYTFYFIRECLARHEKLIQVHGIRSRVEYYPEDIRKVFVNNEMLFERKQKLASVVVGVGMKLHLSSETPSNSINVGVAEPISVRNKVTTVYEFQNHIFELSIVNSDIYEIEIEYYDDGDDLLFTTVSNTIKSLQAYLTMFQMITCNVNTSLGASAYNLSFNVNKPINLKNNHNCSNHVATLKMDGIRMLLVIHPLKSFLYNHNTLLFFPTDSTGPKVSILDVEYFTDLNECIAFDLCVYNGKDYRFNHFQTRYNTLLNISPVPVARYYYDFSNVNIDFTHHPRCDGVIYTPLDTFYHNHTTYKWKPIDRLTVDLKSVGGVLLTSDNVQVGEAWGDDPFIGEYIPLGLGEFKLLKARPDKEYPNSYKIVQDVLQDIFHPVAMPVGGIKKDEKSLIKEDTMKPRQENKSCYFTFGGRIPYLVRTGLPQCQDEMEFYLAATIVSKHKKYDRAAVLKTIRCDISRETFIETKKGLSLSIISRLKDLYKEDQNVRVKFIFENVLKLDDALSYIQPHEFPHEFVKDCMEHFDEKMGYSSQRYKIEILRKELEDCLGEFLEKSIDEAYSRFKDGLTPIEMSDLEMMGDGIHVVGLDHEDMKTVCPPSKTGKSIVLIEFDSPTFGDRTIELLGKFDDVIDYYFTPDDSLFSFFNLSEEDTP